MSIRNNRRDFLKMAAGVGLITTTGLHLSHTTQASAETDAITVVVVGAGLAGMAAINRLSKQLPNARLILIDSNTTHRYQPGYTLLATGIWSSADKVLDDNVSLVPKNVKWVQSRVHSFEPDQNQLLTEAGETIKYDFLVVATGLRLAYEQIQGLSLSDLGTNGIGSVYASPEIALATWQQIDQFRQRGGRAVMTLAHTDMKCAGAPLKMTFMLHDRLQQAKKLDNSQVDFFSPSQQIFSVPKVNENVLNRWKSLENPIEVHFERKLTGIDVSNKTAIFTDPQGGQHRENYDFIHVVPPMEAVASVKNSPLANAIGWLDVDKYTLQHIHYPNVFGLGDINGTPKGKTAATVKLSAPVMVQNLMDVMKGKRPSQKFNGYTSCPLLVEEGKAMLVEFDYENNLTPTVPFVDPLKESYFAWFLEEMMLKPAYMAVAKGRV
jgi:sulfide:quinone oxidoreductase